MSVKSTEKKLAKKFVCRCTKYCAKGYKPYCVVASSTFYRHNSHLSSQERQQLKVNEYYAPYGIYYNNSESQDDFFINSSYPDHTDYSITPPIYHQLQESISSIPDHTDSNTVFDTRLSAISDYQQYTSH